MKLGARAKSLVVVSPFELNTMEGNFKLNQVNLDLRGVNFHFVMSIYSVTVYESLTCL